MRISKELQEVWNLLQDGETFYYTFRYEDGSECKTDVLYLGYSTRRADYGTEYLYWEHYGASANRNKITELYWIITTIFGMTAKQFLSTYNHY